MEKSMRIKEIDSSIDYFETALMRIRKCDTDIMEAFYKDSLLSLYRLKIELLEENKHCN
jgi:hypothetical protein